MNKKQFIIMWMMGILLGGCATIGATYKFDPWSKLKDAYIMMDEGRFIRVKQFIEEAETIFTEQGDRSGLAEVYHAYGNFYKCGESNTRELPGYNHYKDIKKSRDYFQRAHDLFKDLGDYMGVAKSLFGIGNTFGDEDSSMACRYYKESLEVYYKAKAENPTAYIPILTDYKDFPDMVNSFMKYKECTK